MGYWDKTNVADSPVAEGGLYFIPGNFLVQIQCCKMIKHNKDDVFVGECLVIDTDVEDKSYQPGSLPTVWVNMDGKFPDSSLKQVAGFMRAGFVSAAAAMGEEAPEFTNDIAEMITGEDNILVGVYLQVRAFKKMDEDGNPKKFTHLRYDTPNNVRELAASAS